MAVDLQTAGTVREQLHDNKIEFVRDVYELAQQKVAMLMGCVIKMSIAGEEVKVPIIGQLEMAKKVTLGADLTLNYAEETRRTSKIEVYELASLVDEVPIPQYSARRRVADYMMVFSNALGRHIDDTIIKAFDQAETQEGNTGNAGQKSPDYTSANQRGRIVHGSTGLTIAKIARAQRYLKEAFQWQDGQMKLVVPADGLEQLKQITEIASHDYLPGESVNKEGRLMRFYGFDIVESERLKEDGNTRNCYAFRKGIIRFFEAADEPLKVTVNDVPTKGSTSIIYQYYASTAMRIEESGIVNIQYQVS